MNSMHLKSQSVVTRRTGTALAALAAVGVLAMGQRGYGYGYGAEGQGTNAPASAAAAAAPAVIKVKGIQGRVQFSRKDGPFVPLAEGSVLRVGDVVRAATGSALDLDLGQGPGMVRVTEGTVLAIEKLVLPDKAEAPFEVELTLRSGELLGLLKPASTDSRFEVKTSRGIARPLRGQFRVHAQGFLVLLEGKAVFAFVPVGGEPAVHTLTAPPACYFTPDVGVQPAPRNLVREVTSQWKARLRRNR